MIDRTPYLEALRKALTQSAEVRYGVQWYDRYVAQWGYIVRIASPIDDPNTFTVYIEGADGTTVDNTFQNDELCESVESWSKRNMKARLPRGEWDAPVVRVEPMQFVAQIRRNIEMADLLPIPKPEIVFDRRHRTFVETDIAERPDANVDVGEPPEPAMAGEVNPNDLVTLLRDAGLPVPAGDRRTKKWKQEATDRLKAAEEVSNG